MNLSDDQADALFPDSREDRTVDDIEDFHLGIDFGQRAHVVLYTDDETFELSESEKEQMLEALDFDTIWQCIGNKFKSLEYLRTHTE